MTEMHNPFAGETPFPPAGEGVVLRFTTSDILRLHSLYGPDPRKPPEVDERTGLIVNSFWNVVIGWIEAHDPAVIMNVLKTGLKERQPDGSLKPLVKNEQWWEDPPFSFADVADQILSGVMWSRWGMTPEQLAAHLKAEAERYQEMVNAGEVDENPQRTVTKERPTSSVSSKGRTKRASRRKKRGR